MHGKIDMADFNKVIYEMMKSESSYNENLMNLSTALSLDINVGKDPLLLQFKKVIFTLKGVSDTLLLNAKVAYNPTIVDEDAHRLLRIQRVSLLKEFFSAYMSYLKLFDEYLDARKEDSTRFEKIEGYFTLYKSSFGGLSFESHLITPIQRGPRYQLLIQAAQQNTDNLTEQNLKELDELLDLVKSCLTATNSDQKSDATKKPYQLGDWFVKPTASYIASFWSKKDSEATTSEDTTSEDTISEDTKKESVSLSGSPS